MAKATFAIASTLALSIAALTPAASAVSYSTPGAPEITSVTAVKGGLLVKWDAPAQANPKITNFVISGGVGSCPKIVSSSATHVLLPALTLDALTVSVRASNAYGFSAVDVYESAVKPLSVTTNPDLKSLQILQLSDFHGAIESTSSNLGVAGLMSAFDLDKVENPRTLTVSSGDNFGAAPPISSQFEELPTIEAMNLMGFDVSTLGNHEHDRDLTHLKKMISASDFEWVVSNYSSLTPLKISANKAVKPYTIIEKDGVQIGVVGINTAQVKEQVFPGNLNYKIGSKTYEISMTTSIPKIQSAVWAARSAGADLVIALVHEGWSENAAGKATGPLVDYAAALKGVAAVYGGHSHQSFSSVIQNTTVAQVRNSGQEYTRTQLCVDTKANKVLGSQVDYLGKSSKFAGDLNVSANTPAAAGLELVSKYKSKLTAKMDAKIGVVDSVAPRGGSPAVERSSEAALGSYIADAIRAKYNTDFVIINGGGIRDTFPAGGYEPADQSLNRPSEENLTGPFDVTLGDAYTALPFGNSVGIVQISGSGIWSALENGVSNYPSDGRFPQISGFKFTFDPALDSGARVTSVTTTSGKAIAKDSTMYSVAAPDFMIYGGDGYTQFDRKSVQIRDLMVDVFVDALKKELQAGKTTKMVTDGRITVTE